MNVERILIKVFLNKMCNSATLAQLCVIQRGLPNLHENPFASLLTIAYSCNNVAQFI